MGANLTRYEEKIVKAAYSHLTNTAKSIVLSVWLFVMIKPKILIQNGIFFILTDKYNKKQVKSAPPPNT